MSSARYILKNIGSMFTANAVTTLVTWLEPPLFLHCYGYAPYADWLVLTASVTVLNNLNFGLQTYVNQELAILYGRGEREKFQVMQSTALRLLLGILVTAAALSLLVFALPMNRLLHLTTVGQHGAAVGLYLIALQILIGNLLFGYIGGNFMSVGKAYRGNYWNTVQRLVAAAAVYTCALLHARIPVLAAAQFGAYALCLMGLMIDQRRVAPEITPSLRHWDRALMKGMLGKSGYFGLIMWSTFFAYQLPLIILQRYLGAFAVVVFSTMRKIFGLGRQVLNGLTQSMGPEITRLYGRQEWDVMGKLYDYSERLVFALAATGNIALLIASPVLVRVWVHRPEMFVPGAYILLCAVNTTMCLKEHKFQFQFSTNTHVEVGRIMFISYLVMSAAMSAVVRHYGINGFLLVMLATEIVQTMCILNLNRKLLAHIKDFSVTYVLKLVGLTGVMLAVCATLLPQRAHQGYWEQTAVALCVSAVTAGASFWIFHLNRMSGEVRARLRARFSREG